MNLFRDWTASTPTERAVNAVLRLFKWDCYIDRHGLNEWQWGIDLPEAELAAHVASGSVVPMPGLHIQTAHVLWAGPFQLTFSRI